MFAIDKQMTLKTKMEQKALWVYQFIKEASLNYTVKQ